MQATVDAIRVFFQALIALLPNGLTIQVPAVGDTVDDATGTVIGTWGVGTPPAVVTGTSASVYAGQSGAVVHWLTTGLANGKRVRGRTYLVPLSTAAYDTQGSIATAALATIGGAAAALVVTLGGNLKVWHRPSAPGAPPPAPFTGQSFGVVATRVPDLCVTLRSRRT